MIFSAFSDGRFDLGGRTVRCALGPAGVVAGESKREGDGASPIGVWPVRQVLYRADRRPPPVTALPVSAIAPDDGWCDDPADANYNRPVRLPYAASAERMWREDHLYDLVLVVGHNDDPVVPGAGSAIFLHQARPDFGPTQGCVALTPADVEALLAAARPGDAVAIVA